MNKRRFKEFTDDEVYILSRQSIEASFNIVCGKHYNEQEIKLHTALMNELLQERKIRDYGIE